MMRPAIAATRAPLKVAGGGDLDRRSEIYSYRSGGVVPIGTGSTWLLLSGSVNRGSRELTDRPPFGQANSSEKEP
jgi:hypothetical protein